MTTFAFDDDVDTVHAGHHVPGTVTEHSGRHLRIDVQCYRVVG